ncbi:COQ9 family protein [Albirhodobacter sp. R86504]|uniref:COQ9 family protein n=1 Tax=Albirhodobacter sp. R86504 TaxID=3093848 RepID=UPI00366E454F
METIRNSRFSVETGVEDLLAAILPHVPFDGWSEPAFKAAVGDLGVDPDLARVLCPRGGVDLAVAYHLAGDRAMEAALAKADMSALKFREKVALAVKLRLEGADAELVRRGASIFALPQNATTGGKLLWGTADAIWSALGDTSEDYNWHTKRMTLSAVYSSVVLYWMGDESEGKADTWAFLDRQIDNVMQFEKVKGTLLKLPFVPHLLAQFNKPAPSDLPGGSSRKGVRT